MAATDVVAAYLNAKLPDDLHVCVRPPQGFQHPEGKIMRLHKALYGLTVSGRAWYLTIADLLTKLGFRNAACEPCLFVLTSAMEHAMSGMPQGCILLICLYVDDALIAYSSKAALQSLHDALTVVDGPVRGVSGPSPAVPPSPRSGGAVPPSPFRRRRFAGGVGIAALLRWSPPRLC